MNRPFAGSDDEVGFGADDEFSLDAADPWRTPAPAAGKSRADDPFADIADPYAVPNERLDPFAAEPARAAAPSYAPSAPSHAMGGGNPVGDMIAGAEAALGDGVLGEASVPRIAIHIFCERQDTAAVADKARRDRRMSRAQTTVQAGGLAAAVDFYRNQPTPSLVIVESQDHANVLIPQLDALAEVCDPGTKVVVIGAHNDIALYRELMRRGVSEYLVPPLQTLQLIRSITTLYSDPSAPFIGRQIAFIGARGGSGSSTIAHNLAHILSERMQTNTVIVDFDLAFGTAGLDFNQDPLQGVADALHQPDRLDPVLLERMMVHCTDRLSLFAAPANLDDDYDISPEAFEEVAGKIRTTAPFVVLDLPHLWSGWVRRTLLGADDVIVTAVPDLASLRNAKNIVDLVRQARPNDAPPRLVLNQVGMPGRPEVPAKDFAAALGIEASLIIGFDAKLFGQASNNGQMIGEINSRSKAADGLERLAQLIARRDAPVAAKTSMLSGLFKRK